VLLGELEVGADRLGRRLEICLVRVEDGGVAWGGVVPAHVRERETVDAGLDVDVFSVNQQAHIVGDCEGADLVYGIGETWRERDLAG
jgi:hypothetical protein